MPLGPRVRLGPVFVAAVTLLLVSAQEAAALEEHERDGWVAGIGFGFGRAKFQGGEALNRIDTGWEEGTTPRLHLGHMLGKRVMLGYEQFQWFDEQGLGTAAVVAAGVAGRRIVEGSAGGRRRARTWEPRGRRVSTTPPTWTTVAQEDHEQHDREQLLLDDVNAIAAAARCAALLPEPHRSESHAILRRYVDLRIEATRDPTQIRPAMAETESLQTRLWAGAVALAREDMNSDIGALYVEALDNMATVHVSRATVSLQYRIPQGVWIVLIALTVLCMGAVGFQFGIAERSSPLLHATVAMAFAAVVAVITQLDRPTEGGFRISRQPMLDLERRLDRPVR